MAPHYLFTHLMKRKRKPIMARPGKKSAQVRKKTKKKTRVEDNPDRLSELPDSLILHILSFLEMRDVVKTGILSKRWQLLWPQVDTIVYDFDGEGEEEMSVEEMPVSGEAKMKLYVQFIYNSLIEGHSASKVKVFSLSGFAWFVVVPFNCEPLNIIIDEWVEYVLGKNVEILKLNTEGIYYHVTDVLYRSSSITRLKLEQVVIKVSSPVNWCLLKFLSLKRLHVEDNHLDNILLGCPVLETLVLKEVTGLTRISITSPSVKKLKLVDFEYEDADVDDLLEIRAPFVQELEILGKFIVQNCVIVDVSSLTKATLKFTTYLPTLEDEFWDEELMERFDTEMLYNYEWVRMASDLLKAMCHVQELLIGLELLQVLSLSSVLQKPCPPFMCKKVTVNSTLWKYDLPGIVCLLENTPHLDTLIVNVLSWQHYLPLTQIGDILRDQHLYFAHENLHLKNVKIDYHRNPENDSAHHREFVGDCLDMRLTDYILRSCVALKRLVLCSSSPCCYWDDKCSIPFCPFQYVPLVSSKLVTNFLDLNGNAEWELRKRKFTFDYRFSCYAYRRL